MRRKHGASVAAVLAGALAVGALAVGYVAFLLWPRWPAASAAPDAPTLPVTVAGELFVVPPAAIRVPLQRHAGVHEQPSGRWRQASDLGRYPDRPLIHLAADTLEGVYRLMSRVFPIAVVGPGLARNFRGARSLLELSVSLMSHDDIVTREDALARRYDGELTILSVGRLGFEISQI